MPSLLGNYKMNLPLLSLVYVELKWFMMTCSPTDRNGHWNFQFSTSHKGWRKFLMEIDQKQEITCCWGCSGCVVPDRTHLKHISTAEDVPNGPLNRQCRIMLIKVSIPIGHQLDLEQWNLNRPGRVWLGVPNSNWMSVGKLETQQWLWKAHLPLLPWVGGNVCYPLYDLIGWHKWHKAMQRGTVKVTANTSIWGTSILMR